MEESTVVDDQIGLPTDREWLMVDDGDLAAELDLDALRTNLHVRSEGGQVPEGEDLRKPLQHERHRVRKLHERACDQPNRLMRTDVTG